jgi:hypothetical protein
MAKLSTAAWIAHDLGLAASFGGLLFGRTAMNPSLKYIESSKADRGRVLNKTWNRYNTVNALSFGIATASWFAGRTALSGRSMDQDAQNLSRIKDVLYISGAVSGLASVVSGLRLANKAPDGAVPLEDGSTPSSETPEQAQKLIRTVNVLGNVNLAITGSLIGLTTALAMKAQQSGGWSITSRLLP